MTQGILFKPWKHKAIREHPDIVTVTRRLDHLKEINQEPDAWDYVGNDSVLFYFKAKNNPHGYALAIRPRYHVGEVVYIKEAWRVDAYYDRRPPSQIPDVTIECKYFPDAVITDGNQHRKLTYDPGRWRSPLHLPARFARDFIQITDVRPERLQEIEKELDGYLKEGYKPLMLPYSAIDGKPFEASMDWAWYENLWDSINPKYPFSVNTWVWRYEFKPVSPDKVKE
jgi:hypothetical protein